MENDWLTINEFAIIYWHPEEHQLLETEVDQQKKADDVMRVAGEQWMDRTAKDSKIDAWKSLEEALVGFDQRKFTL